MLRRLFYSKDYALTHCLLSASSLRHAATTPKRKMGTVKEMSLIPTIMPQVTIPIPKSTAANKARRGKSKSPSISTQSPPELSKLQEVLSENASSSAVDIWGIESQQKCVTPASCFASESQKANSANFHRSPDPLVADALPVPPPHILASAGIPMAMPVSTVMDEASLPSADGWGALPSSSQHDNPYVYESPLIEVEYPQPPHIMPPPAPPTIPIAPIAIAPQHDTAALEVVAMATGPTFMPSDPTHDQDQVHMLGTIPRGYLRDRNEMKPRPTSIPFKGNHLVSRPRVACWMCQHRNHAEAVVCHRCGSPLASSGNSSQESPNVDESDAAVLEGASEEAESNSPFCESVYIPRSKRRSHGNGVPSHNSEQRSADGRNANNTGESYHQGGSHYSRQQGHERGAYNNDYNYGYNPQSKYRQQQQNSGYRQQDGHYQRDSREGYTGRQTEGHRQQESGRGTYNSYNQQRQGHQRQDMGSRGGGYQRGHTSDRHQHRGPNEATGPKRPMLPPVRL